MGSKKTDQDPPVPPLEYAFAVFLFNQGTEAALDAEDYNKLDQALEVIQELCRRKPNDSGLLKFHAGISNMCASMATNPHDINLHRRKAITCAQDFALRNPASNECAFYLAYFLRNLSYDVHGLKQAIQECNRGLALENPDHCSRNWREELHGLRRECEAKLKILMQESKVILNSEAAPTPSENTQEISDPDDQKIREISSYLPKGTRLAVFKGQATSQDDRMQDRPLKKLEETPDSIAERVRDLVASLSPGTRVAVVPKAKEDSSQEEQSRAQEINVHAMSREVPALFFEHMRQDMQRMNQTLAVFPDQDILNALGAMLKFFPKDVPKDESSSS